MRYLWVKNAVVVNVVEYGLRVPPDTEEGCDVVPVVTGTESVGDAFDMTDTLNERRIAKLDFALYRELFRLTNEVRVLRGLGVLTAAQYRTFFKSLT